MIIEFEVKIRENDRMRENDGREDMRKERKPFRKSWEICV